MPNDSDPISWGEFRDAISFVLLSHQQQSELIALLMSLLVTHGVIPEQTLRDAVDRLRNSEKSRKARESLSSLAASVAMQDILKNF